MSEIERKFDYKPEAGMTKLLGALCIIMSPLTMWMTFQEASPGDDDLLMFGKGWFLHLSGPIVPWVIRLIAVLLIPLGVMFIRAGRDEKDYGGRVEFTSSGFIFEAGKPQGRLNEIPYSRISDVRVHEKRGKGYLTYWYDGTKYIIESKRLRSIEEFEEMAKMLQERVATAEQKVPVAT